MEEQEPKTDQNANIEDDLFLGAEGSNIPAPSFPFLICETSAQSSLSQRNEVLL